MLSFKKKTNTCKFIGTGGKYVLWEVDASGDCRISIHDGKSVVSFHHWLYSDEPKTIEAFDKSLGILVDEINAFRKAAKLVKGIK